MNDYDVSWLSPYGLQTNICDRTLTYHYDTTLMSCSDDPSSWTITYNPHVDEYITIPPGFLNQRLIINEDGTLEIKPEPEPNNDFEAPSDIQDCIEELLKE